MPRKNALKNSKGYDTNDEIKILSDKDAELVFMAACSCIEKDFNLSEAQLELVLNPRKYLKDFKEELKKGNYELDNFLTGFINTMKTMVTLQIPKDFEDKPELKFKYLVENKIEKIKDYCNLVLDERKRIARRLDDMGFATEYSIVEDENIIVEKLKYLHLAADKTFVPEDIVSNMKDNWLRDFSDNLITLNNNEGGVMCNFKLYGTLLDKAASLYSNSDVYQKLQRNVKELSAMIKDIDDDDVLSSKDELIEKLNTVIELAETYTKYAKTNELSKHDNHDVRARKVVAVEGLTNFAKTTLVSIGGADKRPYANINGITEAQTDNLKEFLSKVDSLYEIVKLDKPFATKLVEKDNKELLQPCADLVLAKITKHCLKEGIKNPIVEILKNKGKRAAVTELMKTKMFGEIVKHNIGEFKQMINDDNMIANMEKEVRVEYRTFEREEHEKRVGEVIKSEGKIISDNKVEYMNINQIGEPTNLDM